MKQIVMFVIFVPSTKLRGNRTVSSKADMHMNTSKCVLSIEIISRITKTVKELEFKSMTRFLFILIGVLCP